jgi:hypothetical protein
LNIWSLPAPEVVLDMERTLVVVAAVLAGCLPDLFSHPLA